MALIAILSLAQQIAVQFPSFFMACLANSYPSFQKLLA